jgi:hypothetical protein
MFHSLAPRSLKVLLNDFKEPLVQSLREDRKPLLPAEVVELVFTSLAEIYALNNELKTHFSEHDIVCTLRRRAFPDLFIPAHLLRPSSMHSWRTPMISSTYSLWCLLRLVRSEVVARCFAQGAAFVKIGPFLKLYSIYAKNCEPARLAIANHVVHNERFAQWKARQVCATLRIVSGTCVGGALTNAHCPRAVLCPCAGGALCHADAQDGRLHDHAHSAHAPLRAAA